MTNPYEGLIKTNAFDLLVEENLRIIKESNTEQHFSTNLDVIRKEILHFDIFEILRTLKLSENLIFVGGTSLRRIYDSPRLSEDLDFKVAEGFAIQALDELEKRIPEFLEHKYGLRTKCIKKVDKLSDTKSLNIDLIMSHNAKVPHRKIHLDFELCPSLNPIVKTVRPIYPSEFKTFPGGFPFKAQSEEEIIADKIVAIARRSFIKGRDFYDCTWLIRNNVKVNPDLISARIAIKTASKITALNEVRTRYQAAVKQYHQAETKTSIITELGSFLNKIELHDFEEHYSEHIETMLGIQF